MRGAARPAPAGAVRWLRCLVASVALACAFTGAAAADDTGSAAELTVPAEAGNPIAACPLRIGRLRADTWIARTEGELLLRLVPEKGILGRCLHIDALTLEGPGGARIEGQAPAEGWSLPIRVGRASTVPAKVDVASERNPGLGLGLSFKLGAGDASSPVEFRYLVGRLGKKGLAGWIWRGVARDACADSEIPLALPADRLVPCSAH